MLQILARQNRQLAQLATDSQTVLAPLARERSQLAGFVVQANTTATATAQRAAAISRTFQLFPSFLGQLRPLMADLGSLADQGTPLMTSLGQSASAVGRQFAELSPFAAVARTSLIELGTAARESQPSLLASLPLAQQLRQLGTSGQPSAALLDQLLSSLNNTGGIDQLMNFLFNGAVAGNGFNSLGHYLRDEPIVSSCTNYAPSPVGGCSSNFKANTASVPAGLARIATQAVQRVSARSRSTSALKGLLAYLDGSHG